MIVRVKVILMDIRVVVEVVVRTHQGGHLRWAAPVSDVQAAPSWPLRACLLLILLVHCWLP